MYYSYIYYTTWYIRYIRYSPNHHHNPTFWKEDAYFPNPLKTPYFPLVRSHYLELWWSLMCLVWVLTHIGHEISPLEHRENFDSAWSPISRQKDATCYLSFGYIYLLGSDWLNLRYCIKCWFLTTWCWFPAIFLTQRDLRRSIGRDVWQLWRSSIDSNFPPPSSLSKPKMGLLPLIYSQKMFTCWLFVVLRMRLSICSNCYQRGLRLVHPHQIDCLQLCLLLQLQEWCRQCLRRNRRKAGRLRF